MTFKEFNFKDNLQKSIDDAGFKEPSPIQKDAIPVVLDGRDMVDTFVSGVASGIKIVLKLSSKI